MMIQPGWDTVAGHLSNWKLNDMRVRSVGTLVYEDDDVVGLGLSICGDDVFGLQLIVKNNIISVEVMDARP
jgi:hypothetical protein